MYFSALGMHKELGMLGKLPPLPDSLKKKTQNPTKLYRGSSIRQVLKISRKYSSIPLIHQNKKKKIPKQKGFLFVKTDFFILEVEGSWH